MNEQIFELAKQAELIQWDTLPSGAITPDHESVVKAQKFAELIVRECARVAIQKQTENDLDNIVSKNPAKDFAYALINHFGIEQ